MDDTVDAPTPARPKDGPSKMAALATGGAIIAAYAFGHLTMTQPMNVLPPEEFIEEDPSFMDGPAPRRYIKFPAGLTATIPKFGDTVLIEIGMAVHADLQTSVIDMMESDPGPIMAPLSEAMRLASEDPTVESIADLQVILPEHLRSGLNEALFTDDLPEPVFEVLILKMVSAEY